MRGKLLGILVWVLYRVLSWTWKLTLVEPPELQERLRTRKPVLFAHWHGDELGLLQLTRHYRIATITSTSKDGEIMDTVLHLLGGATSRGSSTRGGSHALRGLLRLIRDQHYNSNFPVDGPKGPLHKAKPGIFEVSRLLQVPIYPGGVACDRAWHFPRSWNKAFLPKPFSSVVVYWTTALPILTSEDDPKSPKWAETLENAVHHAKSEAQKTLVASKTGDNLVR